MRNRGFALVTVLVISTAILIMGMGAMYMSEMGFRSISAESRWHLVEKAANAGLMQTAGNIARGQFNCGGQQNLNLNGANVEVRTTSSGGACFLWARATSGNASVVKVGVLTAPSTNHGAAVFRSLNNISVGGSGAITSCDPNCRTSALVIGNSLNNPPTENLVSTCTNNPNGVTALVDPYVPNAFSTNTDLTNRVFNNINNRGELLTTLSNNYRVQFNDGRPTEISGSPTDITDNNGNLKNISTGSNIDVCKAYYNNCTGSDSAISCTGATNLTFVWNGTSYDVRITGQNNNLFTCRNIDFGPNATLTLSGFTGGGILAANQINLGSTTGVGNNGITLVARNLTQDNANNITIISVNIFSQNITLDNNGLIWEGGILYSGGAGVGNFNINLSSNSSLGTSTNPVLIISDNNINIQRNGNAEINGLVFATSSNNNFSIGAGNGNFSINGMVFSNSTSNNNINISENFSINFNANILRTLSQRYSFLRPPDCTANVSVSIPFMQTRTTTY